MGLMMKNLFSAWVPVLTMGFAFAEAPPGPVPPGGEFTVLTQAQQRRVEVRQAVEAHRSAREARDASERRLSLQERAELRLQIRQHGQFPRDSDSKR